jgi:hypothetical protein
VPDLPHIFTSSRNFELRNGNFDLHGNELFGPLQPGALCEDRRLGDSRQSVALVIPTR